MTAWLREEAPGLRQIEYACDVTVPGDKNISLAISGNGKWVDSSGRNRSSAAVSAEAPGEARSGARDSCVLRSSACGVPKPYRGL